MLSALQHRYSHSITWLCISQNLPHLGDFSQEKINTDVDQEKDAEEYFKEVLIMSIGIHFNPK